MYACCQQKGRDQPIGTDKSRPDDNSGSIAAAAVASVAVEVEMPSRAATVPTPATPRGATKLGANEGRMVDQEQCEMAGALVSGCPEPTGDLSDLADLADKLK